MRRDCALFQICTQCRHFTDITPPKGNTLFTDQRHAAVAMKYMSILIIGIIIIGAHQSVVLSPLGHAEPESQISYRDIVQQQSVSP